MKLDKQTLGEFLSKYADSLFRVMQRNHPSQVVEPEPLEGLLRAPMGRQALAVTAATHALREHGAAIVVGEMGTGKTFIAAATAHRTSKRTLVLCPPHLVEKWRQEILETVPDAQVVIAETITDLERARALQTPLFVILSRERAKLGPKLFNDGIVARKKLMYARDARGAITPRVVEYPVCVHCGRAIEINGLPATVREARGLKRPKCEHCHEPLYNHRGDHSRRRDGSVRYPLAEYVKRKMRGFFDLLVLDEAHEYKAADSAQAIAAGMLAESIPRVLSLTGTLFGGYASTLFFLLWRFSKHFRRHYGYHEVKAFIVRYGAMQHVKTFYGLDYGITARRGTVSVRSKEAPSVNPLVLRYLLPFTVFLKLSDVAPSLPSYSEQILEVAPSKELAGWYQEIKDAFAGLDRNTLRRVLGAYFHATVHGPDTARHDLEIRDPENDRVILYQPGLTDPDPLPKEQALIDLVREERAAGRRVIVFVQNTKTRPLAAELERLLSRNGFRAQALYAETTTARKREAWLKKAVKSGVEVLILHPRLVQTGLDLIDFPTLVYYQVEPSVYVLRQAARRSWRIGQRHPVRVVYMVYADTLQVKALSLLASKAQASLAIEGHLLEGGLQKAAHAAASLSLARALVDTPNVEFDPERIRIATLGIESTSVEGVPAQTPHGKQERLGTRVPKPKRTPQIIELPTVGELEEQGNRLIGGRKRPAKEEAVLFPELLLAG